jgi:hypothetical protein
MVTESVDERVAQAEDRIINHVNQANAQAQASMTLALTRAMDDIKQSMHAHVDSKIADLTHSAFPEGPIYKHREFHESRIRNAENNERIKGDLMSWAFKGVIGLFLILVGSGALEWLKRELSK